MNICHRICRVGWFSRLSWVAVLGGALLTAFPVLAQTPPGVTTGAGTLLRPGQALLSGMVNPHGQVTEYWFEHGTTSSYGQVTPANTVAGTNVVSVSNLLTSLPRGVSYNFRLVASNSAGLATGLNAKFTSRAGSNTASGSTGAGQPWDIRAPSLELNYIICTAGIYPSPDGSVEPPFVGEVRLFAGNFAPSGWAFCHGQLVGINEYETLFYIIGTTYGGDGQTTFALPDFRGRTIVGRGPGPEGFTRALGERGGANHVTLTLTNLPLHHHPLPPPDATTGSGYIGDGQSYSNMPPYLVMSEVLWRSGIFPSPNQNTGEPFIGQVSFFAGGYALNNPMPASGQLLSINQNQALFAVLGTNYGGNGLTTFAIPNLNGRSPMGLGMGPGPTNWALAQQAGAVNATLAPDQLPAHQHSVPGLGIDTGPAGNGAPVRHTKPSLTLRYIICTNGFFPARPLSGSSSTPKAIGDSHFLGQINLFAGEFVPQGWLACDGQLLSIVSNVSLWALLGTNYGGNGTNNFALPDLSSRLPVGSSNGRPGAAYGAQQTVLTAAELPAHAHTVPTPDFDRWITSYGLTGAEAGFDGDADGDGVSNGYEWATGTVPTDAALFTPLTIAAADTNVLIRFPRNTNATDIRLAVHRTVELGTSNTWATIASNHHGAWMPSAAPVSIQQSGSTNPLTIILTDRRTNSPGAFYRLRIE